MALSVSLLLCLSCLACVKCLLHPFFLVLISSALVLSCVLCLYRLRLDLAPISVSILRCHPPAMRPSNPPPFSCCGTYSACFVFLPPPYPPPPPPPPVLWKPVTGASSGFISKFGVGALQAGFYIGSCLTVRLPPQLTADFMSLHDWTSTCCDSWYRRRGTRGEWEAEYFMKHCRSTPQR